MMVWRSIRCAIAWRNDLLDSQVSAGGSMPPSSSPSIGFWLKVMNWVLEAGPTL